MDGRPRARYSPPAPRESIINEENLPIHLDGLTLEGRLRRPAAPAAGVVVCHPHPLYGGDMDNPVVVRAVEVCAEVNVATLRFNFRGVGASGGAHGRGVAEEEDVRAAVATLAATLGAPVATAAYLFGAAMVARLACVGDPLAGLLLVAPPLGRYDFDCLARTQVAPLALIAGTRDPLCPAESLRSLAARLPGARTRLVEGADHYFFGKLYPLGEAIADWARDLVAPGNSAGGGGAR